MEESSKLNTTPSAASESAPRPVPMIVYRRERLDAEFSQIIFGTPDETFKKVENEVIPLASELMPMLRETVPNAADTLYRILIRLVGLYVKKPKDLINFMVPRYYDVLHTYAFGNERDESNAEGTSDFWLYRGTNQNLQILDQVHIPGLSESLYVTTHQVFVARSLLRLQALHFDMAKIANIEKIHSQVSKALNGRNVGYTPPDPKNFKRAERGRKDGPPASSNNEPADELSTTSKLVS
ncbi:hypothetical protein KUV57_11945 [Epibacterium sp. DP7N7-1]|nr:hypothetical protein [Epibacterium sp. DP7N7-1]